ncbi:MAG: cation transporter [Lentimicrobiaceae bacterium]|nr:cation transporter [Lentimicrobiaceae bacterium]MCB9024347.1 cation transporter [Lentimicrobiaceae bacterium]MCO5264688.1 cation transporter [Lentimicrobium sp.]HPG32586.1 cation transporter [Lentimicrobium sp.]
MKIVTFKTNLKCNGCIAAVKPALDAIETIHHWEVDLTHADKLMQVESDSEEDTIKISKAFSEAGYQAILIDQQ